MGHCLINEFRIAALNLQPNATCVHLEISPTVFSGTYFQVNVFRMTDIQGHPKPPYLFSRVRHISLILFIIVLHCLWGKQCLTKEVYDIFFQKPNKSAKKKTTLVKPIWRHITWAVRS